jgi:hypothetical protein
LPRSGSFAVAPVASAVPFTVELTIPDASGYTFPSGSGTPGTPFTAPYLVVRVTGDNDNVIYRGAEGGARYQASSVRIEIPGIGQGGAPGEGFAVYVDSGKHRHHQSAVSDRIQQRGACVVSARSRL